ncbi:transposase [Sphingobacterium rhinopitheci]|uniref:transposase n=1 Tax=Sphingobacterium rhinopitheci TaxID=2781960 RepID=UPI001F5181E4|nr:transposase [Sphingobacterium rhinopitheci]MCI0921432.1 transposase [Sphingobacterium rhinopitheci]
MHVIIITKDTLIRKINDLIDFTFIYDELLEKYCHTNGRTIESPKKMFKYLLIKTIYTISEVPVVERSRYDLSFKYFLEMPSEDDLFNSSLLTEFRNLY